MAAVRRSGRRVIVLCEGETEEIALREFVRRQWNSEGLGLVGLETRNLHGHLTKAGLFAKGYLDDPTVLAVFTLIDLQGMTLVEHAPNDDVQTKVMRVQDWLHDEVQHPRSQDFHPHVAVHETEAWILAEGSALARRLRCTTIHPDPQAELKNFQRPPSERINDLFRQHRHGQAKAIRKSKMAHHCSKHCRSSPCTVPVLISAPFMTVSNKWHVLDSMQVPQNPGR